jgi:superfamily II DNA or RNA helicase
MLLADRLRSDFSAYIRVRGEQYLRNGWVGIVEAAESAVRATVSGSRPYRVEIQDGDRGLQLSCECPFFDSSGPCKHLWATVLAADQAGYLTAVADRPKVTALYEQPPVAETPPAAPVTRAKPPAPPPDSQWREQLRALLQSEPIGLPAGRDSPDGRELHYVIDGPGSMVAQSILLNLRTRERKADGDWGKWKEARITYRDAAEMPNPLDRELIAILLGAPSGYQTFGSAYPIATRYPLRSALADVLLPRLAHTGRAWIQHGKDPEQLEALCWSEAEPWRFVLELRRAPAGHWQLDGELRRGSEVSALSANQLIVPGFLLRDGQVSRLEATLVALLRELCRLGGSISIPAAGRDDALRDLLEHPSAPHVELPPELGIEEKPVAPRPFLRIAAADRTYPRERDRLTGEVSFDYGGRQISADAAQARVFIPEDRLLVSRAKEAEETAWDQLRDAGFRWSKHWYRGWRWELVPSRLPRAVRLLVAAGWHVEAHGKLFRKPGGTRLEVASGIDWFELNGEVSYGDTSARLPELLESLRRGDGLLRLDDGTYGLLPEEWLKKFAPFASMGRAESGRLRFHRSQAGLLDALLAAEPEALIDEAFARWRDQLHQFHGIQAPPQPAGFRGELREYQREGLGWMQFLRQFGLGGCLADDMGVGKTAQVLAMLEQRRTGHERQPSCSLVVVPKSLVFNWKQEAARFTPALRVVDYTGLTRDANQFNSCDLVLTTYGTLRRDILVLKNLEFDYVILDEAQAIKNADTDASKAARLLSGRHRLALSGTPIENHLGELWSLFEFLNPGILGSSAAFARASLATRDPDNATRQMLAQALRPFILRRTKKQVARELPEKTEQVLYCELEADQRRLYDQLRDHYRTALLPRVNRLGLGRSKIQVLEALLRLRQAACHPGLIDPGRKRDPSAKLDLLLDRLTEVRDEGHKALVFSQFTSLLDLLRAELDRRQVSYEYLDGKTRDRATPVNQFQNDTACPLFLISLKAGGLGLNLTAADYVFLLDPWWNPAVEAQAIDRTHRIGQEKHVFAYRLIARGTVEEKVLELQSTKRELAAAIIGDDNGFIRDMKREDLEFLLS